MPFPFVDFDLYPFVLTDPSFEYKYTLSLVSVFSELLNWGQGGHADAQHIDQNCFIQGALLSDCARNNRIIFLVIVTILNTDVCNHDFHSISVCTCRLF